MQKDFCTNFGMVTVESVTHNINQRNARSLVVGIDGDALNFPFGFDFKFQPVVTIGDDVTNGLLQIAFACAGQQQIVHVTQRVLDIVRPLAATELAKLLLDVMIQRLQEKVCKPLDRIGADRQSIGNAIYHLVQNRQNLLVLDNSPKCFL